MKNFFLIFVILSAPLFASTLGTNEELTMLVALFALAFIGIISLFLSSKQLSKVKSEHAQMMKHQEEIEHRQSELLVEMSKNIQNITKETLGDTTKLKTTNESVQKHISKVISSENTIIDATSDLIEFLQIKSKKVHPLNENFKLENLLNDILGQIKTNHSEIDLELIFDVDDNIPDMLNSDTLGISKILVNLIEFCIVNSSKQIAVQVSKRSKFNAPTTLHFVVYSNTMVTVSKDIFKTKYNEQTKKYDGMALFVSYELAELMGGTIIARNNHQNSNVEFVLNLPYYEVNANTLKENRLNTKLTQNQKIFLVDSSYETTLAIKRILQTIKCDVDTQTKEEFLSKTPDLSKYTTILIDEKLINSTFTKTISNIQKDKRPNLLTLSNIFAKTSKKNIDAISLHKPLTKESIFYTLSEFNKSDKTIENNTSNKKLLVHRDRFADAPNIKLESFAHFSDTNLLIVEDNLINQKVLTSVLKKSNMNITIANDGQEAVDILNDNNQFDMVLMDINMPIMDGYEATRKIRQNKDLDMVPIVALSALTAADEINKVFIVGMNGYLSKPLEKEKLYTAFDKFINKKNFVESASSEDLSQEVEIKNLDGLNVENGLKQAGGNPIFYIEVLKEFVDAYGDSDVVFEKLVYEHRFEQARMLCLDMRGLAGAVGADDMQEFSSEILQKIIFKKYDMLGDYVKAYKEKLAILNNSIEKYISVNS
ncbi:response regulator [Sulfurimonas sp.]|uniref:response regulator n=1 Tax=Sulfurimonas sp. TaxID=2022749 RepID=UPI003562EE18